MATTGATPKVTYVAFESHSKREPDGPNGWPFYVSHYDGHVKRLVVFVHGFRGKALDTWLDFPKVDTALPENQWWLESDWLFVGYESTKETVTGVANRITREMPRFFPQPLPAAMDISGAPARQNVTDPYTELVLVGHSLGGVILRRALCDAAQEWLDDGRPDENRPVLLHATTRLFSSACGGFSPSGRLGLLRSTPVWDRAIDAVLRQSPAYVDLQPGSLVLEQLRSRTIAMAPDKDPQLEALRARILWANPDGVVTTERYATDYVDLSQDGKHHISICKPKKGTYHEPWTFVRTGRTS